MSTSEPDLQHDLIAYAMGLMSPGEASAFAARLANDAGMRDELAALRRMLAPLDAWATPAPEADFVDRVMREVATATPLTYVAAHSAMPPVESTAPLRRRAWVSLPELFALAACLALILSVYFPMMSTSKAQQRQVACGVNQASLYRGLQQYARSNDDYLPRVANAQAGNWLSSPQRQNWKPLIQGRFVAPQSLFCNPTTGARYDEATVRRNIDAFLRRSDVQFFNGQHPQGGGPRLAMRFRMPLAADPNPMFENGRVVDPIGRQVNSPTHEGRGQNVLFNDGSVEFLRSPLVAPADNIWRAEHVDRYLGNETPQSVTDSFLIP